ncbi:hypothetical protein [Rhizobium alvei]|uniref:Uncharacterized protein n=1 Tax=Rhizobium alvei TaxID=1132659 RepID=A0ABT8YSY4_9HYPH|nr:hypothetical protein [Rhizobium alvei]MDO6966325.1 hypothetical protein [Rhizobium alvei]
MKQVVTAVGADLPPSFFERLSARWRAFRDEDDTPFDAFRGFSDPDERLRQERFAAAQVVCADIPSTDPYLS